MKKYIAAALLLIVIASPAEARHRRHGGHIPWCGIYYMDYKGIHKAGLALARNWAKEGRDAGGPGMKVTVVWPHHVGEIVGGDATNGWVVHSGNDGGRVRTRIRSLRGVIAFRYI